MPASLRAGGRRLPGGKAFFPDVEPPAASVAIPGPAPPSLTPMEPSGRRFNSTKPVHFQACGVVFFEAHPDRGHKPGRSHSPRSGPRGLPGSRPPSHLPCGASSGVGLGAGAPEARFLSRPKPCWLPRPILSRPGHHDGHSVKCLNSSGNWPPAFYLSFASQGKPREEIRGRVENDRNANRLRKFHFHLLKKLIEAGGWREKGIHLSWAASRSPATSTTSL